MRSKVTVYFSSRKKVFGGAENGNEESQYQIIWTPEPKADYLDS